MAWKNLKQRSLADSMVVPHEAVKELDELNKLINWSLLYQGVWLFMQFILQLLRISSQWLRNTELKVTTGKGIRNFRTCPCCKKKGVDSADLAQGSRCLHCGKIIEVDFFMRFRSRYYWRPVSPPPSPMTTVLLD